MLSLEGTDCESVEQSRWRPDAGGKTAERKLADMSVINERFFSIFLSSTTLSQQRTRAKANSSRSEPAAGVYRIADRPPKREDRSLVKSGYCPPARARTDSLA